MMQCEAVIILWDLKLEIWSENISFTHTHKSPGLRSHAWIKVDLFSLWYYSVETYKPVARCQRQQVLWTHSLQTPLINAVNHERVYHERAWLTHDDKSRIHSWEWKMKANVGLNECVNVEPFCLTDSHKKTSEGKDLFLEFIHRSYFFFLTRNPEQIIVFMSHL